MSNVLPRLLSALTAEPLSITALPVVVPQPPPTRDELIARTRNAHTEAINHLSRYALAGIAAGKALNEAKAGKVVKHGQWPDYYADCGISERMAQHYMDMARHEGEILQWAVRKAKENSFLTQTEVLGFLKAERKARRIRRRAKR